MSVTSLKTKPDCSPVEWKARVDLAALFRIIAHYNMSDLVNGAIGARVPDEPDHYLVHPYGMFWEEARASDMVKINALGQPVESGAPWLNDGAQNLCLWILGSFSSAAITVIMLWAKRPQQHFSARIFCAKPAQRRSRLCPWDANLI